MANILFKKGSFSDFEKKVLGITRQTNSEGKPEFIQGTKNITEGALYLTEDEGGLYLGLKDNEIKRIAGSVVIYENALDFEKDVAPPYKSDIIYFIVQKNAFIRWNQDTKKWIVLNATASDTAALITQLDTKIEAEITRATKKENDLEKAVAANTASIKTKANASDLTAEVNERKALSNIVATHTTQITNLDTKITAETTRATNKENEMSEKISKNTSDISTKANASDLTAEIAAREALSGTVATHTSQIADLGVAIDDRVTYEEFESVCEEIGTIVEDIYGYLEELDDKVVNIEDFIDELNNVTIPSFSQELGDVKGDIADLETQVDTNTTDIETLAEAIDTLDDSKLDTVAGGNNTMATNLSMGGHEITNLKVSTTTTSAATVGQVNTVQSSLNTTNANVTNLNTAISAIQKGLSDTGINTTAKTIKLQNDLDANSKKITGLADAINDKDAVTFKQAKSLIAANDAMTFKGTVGTDATISDLPIAKNVVYSSNSSNALYNQKPQRGDVFKVKTKGTYAKINDDKKIEAKIGDLIINIGADDEAPIWEHITSGYEDDYLQKLIVNNVSGQTGKVRVGITDGIDSSLVSDFTIEGLSGSNLSFSVSGTSVVANMVWESF